MKKRYSSARYAGSGTPVNRQAAVAVSSGSMRVGVKIAWGTVPIGEK